VNIRWNLLSSIAADAKEQVNSQTSSFALTSCREAKAMTPINDFAAPQSRRGAHLLDGKRVQLVCPDRALLDRLLLECQCAAEINRRNMTLGYSK
jgi:hypothetical protein